METPRFKRHIEDFTCESCGCSVSGNGYRNHCPSCLYSKHVDINPGDRNCLCKGLMKPICIERKGSIERIRFLCVKCNHQFVNTVAPDDDREALLRVVSESTLK